MSHLSRHLSNGHVQRLIDNDDLFHRHTQSCLWLFQFGGFVDDMGCQTVIDRLGRR